MSFAFYGSLIPFDFKPFPTSRILGLLNTSVSWQINTNDSIDFGANILLIIPISFFLLGTLLVDRRESRGTFVLFGLVIIACSTFSIAIEFCQLWFPSRVVSASDVCAQFIGAISGALLWLAAGQRWTDWSRCYTSTQGTSSRLTWLMEAYFLAFCAYSLMPLDITLHPEDLYRKYRDGRILLQPFQFVYGSTLVQVYTLITDVVVYLPLGVLFSAVYRQGCESLRSVPRVVSIGIAFSVTLEVVQVFVKTRIVDASDVIFGTFGIYCGSVLAHVLFLSCDLSPRRRLGPRSSVLAAAIYVIVLFLLFWAPFNFVLKPDLIYQKLQAFMRIPFSVIVWSNAYTALNQWVQKTVLFGALGILVMHCFAVRQFMSRRFQYGVLAAILTALVAIAIECGQLFLPTKSFDSNDVIVCSMGGAVGVMIRARHPKSTDAAAVAH